MKARTQCIGAALAVILGCQMGSAIGGGQAMAQESAQLDFSVEAGPLSQSLLRVSTAFGVPVIAANSVVAGRQAEAVSGFLTAEQAVARLLQGSGLTAETSPDGAIFVLGPAGINGQNDEEGETAVLLDEIVVQGELQARTLQNTQTSVAVVPGAVLEARDDSSLRDTIERIPNVSSTDDGGAFVIRGVDSRGPAGAGQGQLISTVVDGVTFQSLTSTFFSPFSTWDLEQVEVLRGPQSTQQGRNSLAGSVIVQSADPNYDFEVKGRFDVARFGAFGGAGAVNIPIIDDTLALRFSAEHSDGPGFIENLTLQDDDANERELTTLRGKLLFEPSDDLSALLSLTYSRNLGGRDAVLVSAFPEDRVITTDFRTEEGNEFGFGSLELQYQLDDRWAIESDTSFLIQDYVRLQDIGNGGRIDGSGSADSVEQELRLRYDGDRMRGVVGGYFTRLKDETRNDILLPLGPFLIPRNTDGVFKTTNFALFGEVEVDVPELLDRLSFIAGGRYDYEKFDSDITFETIVPPGFPIAVNNGTFNDSTTFSAFLPKAGIIYQWTPDLQTSFVTQRGYRAGGTQINGANNTFTDFDPEFTWNFEFALRSEWLDGDLTANANIYYTRWTDQQVILPTPGSTIPLDQIVVNAGRSRLIGGELDLTWRATDSLDLFGSVGIAHTEFVEFIQNNNDFSGNQFRTAPLVSAAFGANYSFDNGFLIAADATYTGDQFSDPDNDPLSNDVEGWFVLNARVGYQDDNWAAYLFARNLLDNDYLISTDGIAGTPGEPLTVGGYVTVNF
ncbi:MAG: TonB-dependent receptor [Pseudomonadota bacterium]